MTIKIYSLSDCHKAMGTSMKQQASIEHQWQYDQWLANMPMHIADVADEFHSGDALHYHQAENANIQHFIEHMLGE